MRSSVLVLIGAVSQCLGPSIDSEPIPSASFEIDFRSEANAEHQVRAFAEKANLEVRDTMVGPDGMTNFLLGTDGAILLFLPSIHCPPKEGEYWMSISVTPETREGSLDEMKRQATLLQKRFGDRLMTEEDRGDCK